MIEIINDLHNFCEDCPYTHLVFKEKLGSGVNVYTCKFLHICEGVYNKVKREIESQENEKINCNITKCENCTNHNCCDAEADDFLAEVRASAESEG